MAITPVDDSSLTLEQRLALFDPVMHGGEAMASEPLGKEAITEDEDAENEALWVAEIQERYRAIQEGTVTCIPADEAMRQARERIKR